jgi:hypothetical protein
MLTQLHEYLATKHPYWNRRGGRDHIFLFTHDEGGCWVPNVLRNATWLVHWGERGATAGVHCILDLRCVRRCAAAMCLAWLDAVWVMHGPGASSWLVGSMIPWSLCTSGRMDLDHRSNTAFEADNYNQELHQVWEGPTLHACVEGQLSAMILPNSQPTTS